MPRETSHETHHDHGVLLEPARPEVAPPPRPDRVPDPNNLRLVTKVNGAVRQDWTTADMIFNCRQLISFASKVMTIKPGDIFYTGTPQGVIFGEKIPRAERQWLKPGDAIVSSLEGLGELHFTLV